VAARATRRLIAQVRHILVESSAEIRTNLCGKIEHGEDLTKIAPRVRFWRRAAEKYGAEIGQEAIRVTFQVNVYAQYGAQRDICNHLRPIEGAVKQA
jgi:hypothetical protein